MKRKFKYFLSTFVGLVFLEAPCLRLQSQGITTTLKPDSILLGQHATLEYSIPWPSGTTVLPPSEKKICREPLEPVGPLKLDTLTTESEKTLKIRLKITSFDSGLAFIPSVPVVLVGPSGDTTKFFTDSLQLYVNTVPVDTTQAFRDIKGPLAPPFDWREYWPLMVGFFVVLLAGAVGFFVWRRWKGRRLELSTVLVLTPAEIAVRDLENLRRSGLWQQRDAKLFYSRLTEILRNFFKAHYGFDAPEMVSDEILSALRLKGMESDWWERFRELFERADMAKFAKAQPLPSENQAALETALSFVLQNVPKPSDPESTTHSEKP